jgi:two-component system chemotaxis sensor kinase CheA
VDEIVKEFLQESSENLDRLDQEFVRLESEPENRELLGSIFRTVHTVKGTCGFLGFTKLETIAHAGENLLSLLRAGELKLTDEIADVLLEMADAIRAILKEIQTTEAEGNLEYPELVQRLKELQSKAGEKKAQAVSRDEKAATTESVSQTTAAKEENAGSLGQRGEEKETQGEKKGSSKKPAPALVSSRLGGALVRRGRVKQEEVIRALELQEAGDRRRIGEILMQLGLVSEQDVIEALADKKLPDAAEAAIRVDVHLLEKQMNLVSELVLLRNRLLQIASETNERNLNATVHGLNYVTSELRKNVMKTRMQPVSQLFDKLPRIVRDVSKDLGKKVHLETQGGNTELDKTLLEAIKDPVTHILRNSIDHGVEEPATRKQRGKPETGTVRISAFHEGGNFHLEIADDGAGIDAERVKQKALSKGLITGPQAEKLTQSELLNLVFLPGLSTAEKVTNVSGRGVGMDVVKTNIEKIGGKAKLDSTKTKGTTVSLEIPLTLATIPALTVISGKSVFAIPQAALVEMMAVDEADSHKLIETIDGVAVFRFRGTVLPLMSLREELKLKDSQTGDTSIVKLVVVRTEGRQFALRVDAIRNTEEIVIKPLDKRFKRIALYSGAAVLGDGRVALILDIPAFARRAGVIAERETRAEQAAEGQKKERLTLLLLGGSDGERLAIPLEYVQRLEEFACSARERMGGLDVVQYRKEILRLAHLEDLLENRRTTKRTEEGLNSAATEKIAALVVRSDASTTVILEVHKILGIVKVEIGKLAPPTRAGVRGSLVVQERVTELLEMPPLLAKLRAENHLPAVLVGAGTEQPHVS